MVVRQPRYSKEEFARRGNEIYESQVRSKVESGNHGRIVAIILTQTNTSAIVLTCCAQRLAAVAMDCRTQATKAALIDSQIPRRTPLRK